MLGNFRLAGAGLLAVFVLCSFGLVAGPATAAEADRSVRILIPDLPKRFKEDQRRNRFVSRKGVFKVKLVGYQINRWTVQSPGDGECIGSTDGGGFERVVFRQPFKRMRLSAFGTRRLTSMILPTMKVRGQLTRQGKYSYIPLANPAADCPYGDGGGDYTPPAPDCGTRKFSGIPVSMAALDGFFSLRSLGTVQQRPRFLNCTSPRVRWPDIITERTNRKPIRTRFPGNLVFNRKFNRKTGAWSKVIVIAKGVHRQRSLTSASTTRLQWTLTLKRLR